MNCNKFLISNWQVSKKLISHITTISQGNFNSNRHVFCRVFSSAPKTKVTEDIRKEVRWTANIEKQCEAAQLPLKQKAVRDANYDPQEISIDYIFNSYNSLSKGRLTSLVVATAAAGYVMAPAPLAVLPLISCLAGTAFTASAANTFNQIIEMPYDSQMSRTKKRVLVRGFLTQQHATTFATVCTAAGLSTLYFGASPLVCALGASNIILYAFIYTPLKRFSISNTWVGSVVGAIPPLMGWAACTGSLEPNALFLAAVLYAWQFPHFNGLSWNYRADYSRAGYKMTCICNEGLCRRAALRYSLLMLPICVGSSYAELTNWFFAMETLPLNLWLVYLSYNFYSKGDSKTSRRLFLYTLVHLPLVLVLMILGKNYDHTSKGKQAL